MLLAPHTGMQNVRMRWLVRDPSACVQRGWVSAEGSLVLMWGLSAPDIHAARLCSKIGVKLERGRGGLFCLPATLSHRKMKPDSQGA